MGSSKAQTVGYKYYLGIHAILVHGPADLLSRFTVDERIAWEGSSTGGAVVVNSPNLFGGESREGGISGTFDLEMGGPAQGPNSYLQSQLGALIPSFREVVGVVMRRMYLGNNPYLKKFGFRLQRIHLRQGGVEQWYDEKAAIPGATTGAAPPVTGSWYVPAGTEYANGGAVFGTVGVGYTATADTIAYNAMYARDPGWAAVFGGSFTYWNGTAYEIGGWSTTLGPGVGIAGAIGVNAVCPDNYVASAQQNGPDLSGLGIDAATVLCTYTPSITWDMNPAHIIRECLTNSTWGMGYHDEDVDDDAFMNAAGQLHFEGMGMSLLWDRQIPIEQFINEVIKHIDAALYVDRKTGKFVLKLVRGGYNLDDLPEFNEDNIDKIENFSRREVSEMSNSVTVNYWDSVTGKGASTTATDPALVQQQGAVINTTLQYPGFTHEGIANRVALRDLRSLSTPLVSFTCYADWDGRDLNIGDVVKVSWDDYGFVALPVRISGLAFGDGVSNKIKLTCVQDVFALPVYGVIVPPDEGWEDPNQQPLPMTRHYAEETPYYELVQQLSQSVVDTQLGTEPDLGFVCASGSRPQQGAINARFMVDAGAGYEDVGAIDFCASAELDGDVGLLDTAWTLKNPVDETVIQLGSYAKVNGEYVVVVDLVGTILTVKRAALDTLPQVHLTDDVVFFSDPFIQLGPTEYVASDEVDVKLLTATGLGVYDESLTTADEVTFNSRAIRPYPPADLQVNAEHYPTALLGDLEFTWATRNRLLQTGVALLGFLDGSVTPEVGQTVTIEASVLAVVVYSEAGLTGTTHTIPDSTFDDGDVVTFEVWSVRDGYDSFTKYSFTATYTSSAGLLLLESGDNLLLESGNKFNLE